LPFAFIVVTESLFFYDCRHSDERRLPHLAMLGRDAVEQGRGVFNDGAEF